MPLISFIIPLHNHLRETQAMLASLVRSLPASLTYEVILVDDASTDGTAEWLSSIELSQLRVVRNDENRGYASSTNAGAKLASGDILGLLNNDLIFEPGWLEPMLDIIRAPYSDVGIVGNIQIRVDNGKIDHAGVALTPLGKFEHLRNEASSTMEASRMLAVTGACALVSREDYEQLGGFDEAFWNGGEDCDLCYRIRALGKRVVLSHKSIVQHHVSLSRGGPDTSDEANSRLLFSKQRIQIKRDLAQIWTILLQDSPGAFSEHLDGRLASGLVKQPHAAGLLIAENLLRRQEHYWMRLLDGVEPSDTLPDAFHSEGLTYVDSHKGYLANQKAIFHLPLVHSMRNFYVCGYTLAFEGQRLRLVLEVNGLQQKSLEVGPNASVNFGIIYPLVVPKRENVVTLTIQHENQGYEASLTTPAGSPLVLTHIVVDDRPCAVL